MNRIFISGPYTLGDVAVNVKKAMDLANVLIDNGYAPFCPHLTHFLHMNNPQPYEKWLELDNSFLLVCDALIRIPGDSNGADKEMELAKSKNIPIFHNIDEMFNHFNK